MYPVNFQSTLFTQVYQYPYKGFAAVATKLCQHNDPGDHYALHVEKRGDRIVYNTRGDHLATHSLEFEHLRCKTLNSIISQVYA